MKATERVSMEANVPHHSIITRFRLFLRCFHPGLYGPLYGHPIKLWIPGFRLAMEVNHVHILSEGLVYLVRAGNQYRIQIEEPVTHHFADDFLVSLEFRILVGRVPGIGFMYGVGKERHDSGVMVLLAPSVHPGIENTRLHGGGRRKSETSGEIGVKVDVEDG